MKFNPQRLALALFAFIVPPILVGTLCTMSSFKSALSRPPIKLPKGLHYPSPPKLTGRPLALIVTANDGTETLELLGAAQILSASRSFQVVTAAPRRELSPTTGALLFVPDFSFADAPAADLIVVPSMLDSGQPEIGAFVRDRTQGPRVMRPHTLVLLGEGVRTTAQSGILDHRAVTAPWMSGSALEKAFPKTRFTDSRTQIDRSNHPGDPLIVSGAGLADSIDAILEWLQSSGAPLEQSTAQILGWQPAQANSSRPRLQPEDSLRILLNTGFDWTSTSMQIEIANGVSDLAVASWLEAIPRTFSARAGTLSLQKNWVQSASGMTWLATDFFDEALPPDVFVIPPQITALDPKLTQWAKDLRIEVKDLRALPPGQALAASLETLLDHGQGSITRVVAKQIGLQVPLRAPTFSHDPQVLWFLIRIFLLGALGVLIYSATCAPSTRTVKL